MKRNLVRLSLLFVLLSVTPQMSGSLASPGVGQATVETKASAKNARCRTKCRRTFGRCTRVPGDVRRRCIIKYRDCLRRCAR